MLSYSDQLSLCFALCEMNQSFFKSHDCTPQNDDIKYKILFKRIKSKCHYRRRYYRGGLVSNYLNVTTTTTTIIAKQLNITLAIRQ